jgi:hypothetical protein
VAVYDLDRDGDLDLAVANQFSDTFSVLLNNGDGTFAEQVIYGMEATPRSVAVGDLDGDLDPDVVVANRDTFDIAVLMNQCPPECPADFDGDGDVDTFDLLFLLGAWGTPNGDVDGDGDTDTADLLALLGAWGECP